MTAETNVPMPRANAALEQKNALKFYHLYDIAINDVIEAHQ